MTVILVLLMFAIFIGIDYVRTYRAHALPKGTMITTRGYEMLGALAQDGGKKMSACDQRAVVEALKNPPEPNDALHNAAKEYMISLAEPITCSAVTRSPGRV